MNPTLQSLQNRIDKLERQLELLNSTQGISRDTQTAIANRLNVLSASGTGTPPSNTSYSAFPVTVGPIPTKTLTVVVAGQTFHLFST